MNKLILDMDSSTDGLHYYARDEDDVRYMAKRIESTDVPWDVVPLEVTKIIGISGCEKIGRINIDYFGNVLEVHDGNTHA